MPPAAGSSRRFSSGRSAFSTSPRSASRFRCSTRTWNIRSDMYRVVAGGEAAPEGVGRVFPLCFNELKGLLAIPLIAPTQGALRTELLNMDTVIELDSLQTLDSLPQSGIVQIEAERLQYTAQDRTNVRLTGVLHGVDGTVAPVPPDSHKVGTPVNEVLPSHVSGFFENPQIPGSGEPRFYHGGIQAVYVNKLLKTATTKPTHVITNDDTAAVFDPLSASLLHVGTVRFDMVDPVATDSPFANPEDVAALQRWTQAQDQALQEFKNQTITGTVTPFGGGKFLITTDTAPPSSGAALSATPQPKVWPLLGAVTADVEGLRDADGSITGLVNHLITNPVHVAYAIIRFGFQSKDFTFDHAGWAAAAAKLDALGYAWTLQFLPMTFSQL